MTATGVRIPGSLPAPAATWERTADVVVVGSGVAGITAALAASRTRHVLVLTKAALDAGSTSWAQGGIAAAIDIADTPQQHLDDTLVAGAGLCNDETVRILVEEGPGELARLIARGARLDTDADGSLSLTREGGHGRPRIVHAGGDATGAEVQRALSAAIGSQESIDVLENAFVVDVLTADGPYGTRRVIGVRVAVPDADGSERVGVVWTPSVVLANGGIGQVYASTTNPPVATGDGMAVALRAGAALADVEFVQFHPTVLWRGPGATGQQVLVSEAVRGEGAVVIDATGARVMTGVHPLEDLAPRDVVAKAMSVRMAEGPGGVDDHLFLDATHIGEETLLRRFPNIVAACRAGGIDPVRQPIPVAPGEHFSCGGVWVDHDGRTSVHGLFAVGETACTGVHGANRLASNSLLEGLVFGDRVGMLLASSDPGDGTAVRDEQALGAVAGPLLPSGSRDVIAAAMSRDAGVRRTRAGLDRAADAIATLAQGAKASGDAPPSGRGLRSAWEAANVLAVATVLLEAASAREESRGCHWRADHEATEPSWERRLVATRGHDGAIDLRTVGLEETP